MNTTERFDVAIAGSGIIGLACAYHLARAGRRVVVCERSPRPLGASIRNFGMIWPIGQPFGPRRDLADRSLAHWRELLEGLGAWHDPCGSLHVAYQDDEAEVLGEYHALAQRHGVSSTRLLDPAAALRLSPYLQPDGLKLALQSTAELCVDPRQILERLPAWLEQAHGVVFRFDCVATAYDRPTLRTSRGVIEAERLIVASGTDLLTLYPETLAQSGLVPCKLQMMRTTPLADGGRLGPMLAGGLTLRHYASFAECPTLPALRERFVRTMPLYDQFGIHVMAAQNGRGELVLGDSHEYDTAALDPFDNPRIDDLILDYLRSSLRLPGPPSLSARWHGVYARHPQQPWFHAQPEPGVTLIHGLGGAGMTLSFGLTEHLLGDELLS